MNVQTFRDRWTKKFKSVSFSRNLMNCTGKHVLFYFALFSVWYFVLLNYLVLQRKQLVGKNFKVTIPRHFTL